MSNILKESKIIVFLRNIKIVHRYLLLITLFILILFIFYFFFIKSFNSSIKEQKITLCNLQKQKNNFTQAINKLNNNKNREFKEYDLNILASLEKYNLNSLDYKFLKKTQNNLYKKKFYELKLSGSFGDYINFLQNYLSKNSFIKIKSINIENINNNLLFVTNLRKVSFLSEDKNKKNS
ncbi:MAG: hypothetical protein SZ59_C0002G0265 [candidate division TM6 bacterium GW2011_GWF2_28_16]|nr:MAG: hypothetical protein SZ59_C0002G0265 [candidate division TM6 bacterium GW2011_GWF2_28_16]